MHAEIRSPSNPTVKALVRLHRRRERAATGTFLVEGAREVGRAAAAGTAMTDLYVCPALFSPEAARLFATHETLDVEATPLAETAFRKASLRRSPDGILAVARTFSADLDGLGPLAGELVLVLEGIEKPGNLGGMLRTAAAAGAAVIVCGPGTDPFNPGVVRASQGALFTVPLAITDTARAIGRLQAERLTIVGATPEAAEPFWSVDYRPGAAVVIGAEHAGLSEAWRAAARHLVAIPMPGVSRGLGVDSLNAGLAAGIVLWEAVRQRTAPHGT